MNLLRWPKFTRHHRIAIEAYYLWEKDGSPVSDGIKYWYEAEHIIHKRIEQECEEMLEELS